MVLQLSVPTTIGSSVIVVMAITRIPAIAIIVVSLGVLVIPYVLSLIPPMSPQILALVSLVVAQLIRIAVAIMLFRLMASEGFSLSPLVASLAAPFAPLMVTKIIVIVSTATTEVAATVKPILSRSDRTACDGRKNDESYCESGCADQFGKSRICHKSSMSLVSSDSADGVIHTHGISSRTEAELGMRRSLSTLVRQKSEMVGEAGDPRLVIGRLINIRLPAHTMSTNSAANGVFDQVTTQLELMRLK